MDKGLAKTPRHIPEPNLTVTGTPDTIGNGNGVSRLTKGWKQQYGVGTEYSFGQGLATKPRTNLPSMKDERVDNPGARTSVRMPSELRLGTVGLAQGLATSKKLKIDVEDLRLRNISDMKGACGPPKNPNFKPPQNYKSYLP